MKKIKLTQGKYAIDDNFIKLNQFKWCANKKYNNRFYAIRNTYENGRSKPHQIYMHHIILKVEPKMRKVVDHINPNSLDNRKVNLRIVKRTENLRNK